MKDRELETIQLTKDFWRAQTGNDVTAEDAREMIENISSYFQILHEWQRKAALQKTVIEKGVPT